jgi:hypothetical protein
MAALSSYGYLQRDWYRNRGLFSGMIRGESNPREGSKILTFPFRSPLVCSLLPTAPKLVASFIGISWIYRWRGRMARLSG